MATLLKGKDAQRNPKTGLELGISTTPSLRATPPVTGCAVKHEDGGIAAAELIDNEGLVKGPLVVQAECW
jgi:hypothetical protein